MNDSTDWLIGLLAGIVVMLGALLAIVMWGEHIEFQACIERGMQWARGTCLR